MRKLAVLGVLTLAGAPVWSQDAARGKAVYDSATPKCKVCHSVAGEGNAKSSLDGVASTLKAERKPPMPAYAKEKLSDADLDSLTAYLLSLKK